MARFTGTRMRRTVPFLAAAAAALAAAPSAMATVSVSVNAGKLTIVGDDTQNQVTVTTAYGDTANYLIVDGNSLDQGDVTAGAGCTDYTTGSSGEDAAKCPKAGITAVTGSLGAGAPWDELTISSGVLLPVQTFDFGPGRDDFTGSVLPDTGLQGGTGDDFFYLSPNSYSGPETVGDEVDGGPGDDRISGSVGADKLSGGDGKDTIDGYGGNDEIHGGGNSDRLDGGDGDDLVYGDGGDDGGDYWILGGDGSDHLDGGEGNDELGGEDFGSNGYNEGEHDTFVGGPGIDETWYTSRNSAVNISLDGVANDGEMNDGGTVVENDNVMPDVERVYGSYGNDVLVGSDNADELIGLPGNDVISGRGGNDDLDGRSGTDLLDGGAGDDKLFGSEGNDKLLGGEGNDIVEGGADDDDIDGGAGVDSFAGDTLKYQVEESGNDTIHAVDGNAEPVSCGPGTDTALLDATDVVAQDPGNICETRTVTAIAGDGSAAGPGAGPNAIGPIDEKLGYAVGRLGIKLGPLLKAKAFNLPVAVARPGTMTVKATAGLKKGRAAAAKAKRVTLGTGKATFFKAGTGKVKVKLTGAGRKALKKAKQVSVTLSITFKDAAGKVTKSTKKVTLRK